MKKFVLILLLWLPLTLCQAEESRQLREQLALAETGDFIVTLQNRAYTLMHIIERDGDNLVLEEISVPEHRRDIQDLSWRRWVGENAPYHTSWVLYEISLSTGAIQESFSLSSQAWLDIEPEDNFLSSLLTLEMERIPPEKRRKKGAPPQPGQQDFRSVWNPRMMVDGEVRKDVEFDAWRANWPKDGSELAGKSVVAYLPAEPGDYPSYFPYWLELSAGIGRAQVRIVDSGSGMNSPAPSIPRRPPTFLDSGKKDDHGLKFRVITRSYYSGYKLLALDAEDPTRVPIRMEFEQEPQADGKLELRIVPLELASKLDPGHRYYFVLSPLGQEHLYARTKEPVRWSSAPN